LPDEQCLLHTGLTMNIRAYRFRVEALAGDGALQEPLLAVLQQLADCAACFHATSEGEVP
jgi:hypothetical protein